MDATRRKMLGVMGWGIAAMGLPGSAGAEERRPFRVLGGEAPRVEVTGQPSDDLRRFLAEVKHGPARAFKGLTVVWLLGRDHAAARDIETLEEARGRGELVITEREHASVPDLIVENRGPRNVLLLAGEVLLGGKQNRVLREDVLLPAKSGARALGVYCVEAGRWNEGRKDFGASGGFAAPAMRAQVMAKAEQRRVWEAVDLYTRAAAAPSPTASYQAVHDKPEVKALQKEAEGALDGRSAPGSVGAGVFSGETLVGLDLFASAALFARLWPKLLRAHVLETYRHPVLAPLTESAARGRVDELLAQAARADGVLHGNAGIGQIFEFRLGGPRGAALLTTDTVVHLAIL
ncbi:MAG: hypothetical protein HY294_00105 [Candidatus Rokubacteria bacterium]|nr:hypothetical protein [Candidatus Rokubacteria bacterium]MBI3824381.1 hypothetical protein [Candidatus Rokubacteria bacterium]